MGYYKRYDNKKSFINESREAYKELNSTKNQPNKTQMFQNFERRNNCNKRSNISCPIYETNDMDPTLYGKLYDFTVNNFNLLENIIYRYFVLDITDMTRNMIYINMDQFSHPTKKAIDNTKEELRKNRIIYKTDHQVAAYIIANNISYITTKTYTTINGEPNNNFNGDVINFGYLFTYYVPKRIASYINSNPKLYCDEIYKILEFQLPGYSFGLSYMEDYLQYTDGCPIMNIFVTSRQYRKNNMIIAPNLTNSPARLCVYNSIRKFINDGIDNANKIIKTGDNQNV